MQARNRQKPQVLHVALTPAAVAAQVAGQGFGRGLETFGGLGQHPHAPARAPQERGLDEIVAQDDAAARGLARQMRQAR